MNSIDRTMESLDKFRQVEEDMKAFTLNSWFDHYKTEEHGNIFKLFGYDMYDGFYKDLRNALCKREIKQAIAKLILDDYRFALYRESRDCESDLKSIGEITKNIREASTGLQIDE